MRRKECFLIVAALAIGIVLTGCGTANDDTMDAAADTGPAVESDSMADFYEEQLEKQAEEAEIWAKAPNDMDAEETPVIEPTLDEVIDDVLSYVESEGMVIVDGDSINEIIEVMYYAEGPDALNIFNVLCDDGKIISAPVVPEGIIVLSYINGSNRTWDSTGTYAMTTFTVRLDSIDPNTGDVSNLRTFSSENINSCSLATNGLGANTTLSLMHFNSDLTQMTATLTLEDGSVHVGWIDESGKFTDVSAKITDNANDFGALINHSNPCFGPGGYFYFRDLTNSNIQDKRVPLDNLTVSAVETMVDDVDYQGLPLYPFPDGTIEDTIWDKNYYYDESMTYPVKGNFFNDWISQSECVGVDKDVIYKYILSGANEGTGFDYWYSEKIAIVPEINGRTNRNPVVSPDGTKVAFLSALTTGIDALSYLYIVPVDGGDPVKVSTDYIFDNTAVYTSFVNSFYATFLLTWE